MAPIEELNRRHDQYRLEQAALGNTVSLATADLVSSRLNLGDRYRGFWELIDQLIQLVTEGRTTSHQLAQQYYADIRRLEDIEGVPPEVEESIFPINPFLAAMIWNGPRFVKSLMDRGQPEAQVRQAVGHAMGGATMKYTLDAGRTSISEAVRADDKSVGWKRVTDSDPCDWCLMLAGRGAVYKNEKTAGGRDQWHDHCGCVAVPVFRRRS